MSNEIVELDSKRNIFFVFRILLCILFILLLLIIIVFSIIQATDKKIKSGVFIAGINVSGLTKEQAKELLKKQYLDNIHDTIFLKYENYTYCISLEQIEVEFNIDDAIDKAYSIGRSGNVIKNDMDVLNLLISNVNVDISLNYNDTLLTNYIEDISSKLPKQVIQPSYYIDNKNLVITSGKEGLAIDTEIMKNIILEGLTTTKYNNTYYYIPTYTKNPDKIDVEKIHEEIFKEPQNAYYTTEPRMVYPHVNGVDFKDNLEDVKSMINEDTKEEYVVPLDITVPNVTTNDLGIEAFPDLIGEFSTNYATSNVDRTTNLKLASNKINGVVLMPGEVFSYNKIVGERTIEAGYKEAAIYQNGKVTSGLGGGICQISSTLYNAAIFANLEFVERRNHMFVPSYVTGGRDATVVYGSTDFQFKNNRSYPIKITSYVNGGVANVKIYGLATPEDYDVEISTKKVKSYNSGGISYSVYDAFKVLKKDGVVVDTVKLSRDTYRNH